MRLGAKIGLTVIGAGVGAIVGGSAGIGGGLLFTEVAGTVDFEGYSGYVIVAWMLAGTLVGTIAGAGLVIAMVRRPSHHR